MRRSFYDFCLHEKVVESGHPHFLDLKFCIIKTSGQTIKNYASKMPKNVAWGLRVPSTVNVDRVLKEFFGMGLCSVLKERAYPDHLVADNGIAKIVRPKIGSAVNVDKKCWLEITPEIVRAAYKTRNNFAWLKELIERFTVRKIVLSSVLEQPPAMRDLVAALALILDTPFDELGTTIKRNSLSLIGEICEA